MDEIRKINDSCKPQGFEHFHREERQYSRFAVRSRRSRSDLDSQCNVVLIQGTCTCGMRIVLEEPFLLIEILRLRRTRIWIEEKVKINTRIACKERV
jgi:hypothetical protein